ncbi:MAG TPA: ferrous iron transport protein B [Bacteroidota bacterium]|nr:ferrous iron transport protein B [Bacteroidota bacterium]
MDRIEQSTSKYFTLVGNPNCGKTTIFNFLTGLHQKVGNYPGVTVERKEGKILYEDDSELTILDLPGTYSLSANSPDEKIVSDILLGKHPTVPKPDGVVCIVDATNVERSLYLVSQIIDLRYPIIIILNMIDVAERYGIHINISAIEDRLGVRVIPTNAKKEQGLEEARQALKTSLRIYPLVRQWKLPQIAQEKLNELATMLINYAHLTEEQAFHEAITLLSTHRSLDLYSSTYDKIILERVAQDYEYFASQEIDRYSVFVQSRIEWIRTLCKGIIHRESKRHTVTDSLDKVLLHPISGGIIFVLVIAGTFFAVFSWATYPMELIESGVHWLSSFFESIIPPGSFRNLVIDGAVAGTGAVILFLPQILVLFFFLGILEESGYMARAAFLMDRVMNRVGLSGKAFIPLLSSFACAVPGIMATRTIENRRDRLVTILVAPLMSCSSRLPIYTLIIAATIPPLFIGGIFNLQAIVMVALYFIGILAALGAALLFKSTFAKGKSTGFIIELPPYSIPSIKNILYQMWERTLLFLKRAGTIILFASIVLWYLESHPVQPNVSPGEQLANSYLGKAGYAIEPVLRPLGFNWKIGVGILSSFFQRELFVSTMSTLYNLENSGSLVDGFRERVTQEIDPLPGKPTFSLLTALCVLLFYVLALQCISTIVVVQRETNSWKIPIFQFCYMNILAYVATFLFYRVGLLIF